MSAYFQAFTTVRQRLWALTPLLFLLVSCVVNPVTGQRQFSLVSGSEELQIGQEYYAPTQQMQGGEYRLDPQLTAYVNQVGQRLGQVSDRDLPYEFVVINSSIPNAWALPGGKIAINRGLLLEMESEAELAAVLAHEIVHAAARHGALAQTRAILLQGVILAGVLAIGESDMGVLALGGLSLAASMVSQRYSREAELESDRYGMIYMSRAGYDPQGAVALQETFVRLSDGRSPDWLSGLFASHPPSQERVNANRATAASLPAGGVLGRDTYQAMTANLRQQQSGYEAIDAGREALADGQLQQARTLADQAVARLPQEALAYALRADVARLQQRPRDALADYNRAIERNPNFYYFLLQRGLVRIDLGEWQGAGSDLQRSVEMLPTVAGVYGLGRVAERNGQLQEALEYYRTAASSQSEEGQAALRALLRLDLPNNPGEYLALRAERDAQGRLAIEVRNPQPVAVTGIVVELRYRNPQGQLQGTNLQFSGRLNANSSVREIVGNLPGLAGATDIQVRLLTARVVE